MKRPASPQGSAAGFHLWSQAADYPQGVSVFSDDYFHGFRILHVGIAMRPVAAVMQRVPLVPASLASDPFPLDFIVAQNITRHYALQIDQGFRARHPVPL